MRKLPSKIVFLIEEIQENFLQINLLRREYRFKWLIAVATAWTSQSCFDCWTKDKNILNWKIKNLIQETESLQDSLDAEMSILKSQQG